MAGRITCRSSPGASWRCQASRLTVGDPVALEGRVQSRVYHKVTEEGTLERVAL